MVKAAPVPDTEVGILEQGIIDDPQAVDAVDTQEVVSVSGIQNRGEQVAITIFYSTTGLLLMLALAGLII